MPRLRYYVLHSALLLVLMTAFQHCRQVDQRIPTCEIVITHRYAAARRWRSFDQVLILASFCGLLALGWPGKLPTWRRFLVRWSAALGGTIAAYLLLVAAVTLSLMVRDYFAHARWLGG